MAAHARSTRVGYLLAATAAAMWALNGSLARFLLDDGVSALRLAQMRSLLAWVILLAAVVIVRPALLRVERADVPRLAFLGIAGLALVHATYFFAIDRLEIGVALTIQYLGPLLILLWLRLAHGRRLARGLWGAAALSLAGSYLVSSERAGRRYEPVTTLAWAFGFASLFWAVVQPLWSFPYDRLASLGDVALALGVAVVGTLLPFVCMVAAVRHIPAPRAAVVATLEPVLAGVFAWAIHGEGLSAVQVMGGLLVVAAVVWIQLQRDISEAESAPEQLSRRRRRA